MVTFIKKAASQGFLGLGPFLFNKASGGDKKEPTPAPLPSPPSVASAEVEAMADITARRRAIARNRTNYTSPLGLSTQQKSEVALKTLTGQ